MAITLGRNAGTAPPVGGNIISASYSEECDTIDASDRSSSSDGYKNILTGFTSKTWEVECHDPDALITGLETVQTSGWQVLNVSENITLDGAVTFTVSLKEVS
jgi:hypothetical protein